MEVALLANTAEVTGGTTTARNLGGIETWLTTNSDRGSGGSDGGTGDTAATDGAQRTFTETLLKNVLRNTFDEGGDPDTILVSPGDKQTFSTFVGNATRFKTAEDKKLVATIDLYDSDFGTLQVYPARYMEGFVGTDTSTIRSALVLQTDMFAMAVLRAPQLQDIAKDGDSERRFIVAEYTLESRNEAASGIVADLS